ncbi:MAG: hypothetical protein QXR14_07500 [Sulfolobales archaeon]
MYFVKTQAIAIGQKKRVKSRNPYSNKSEASYEEELWIEGYPEQIEAGNIGSTDSDPETEEADEKRLV